VIGIAAGHFHNLALIEEGAPPLSTTLSGWQMELSWPLWAADFHLESTTNLANVNGWMTAGDTPTIVGSQYVVTNPLLGEARFYRLKK
jgi:hypothetical protein